MMNCLFTVELLAALPSETSSMLFSQNQIKFFIFILKQKTAANLAECNKDPFALRPDNTEKPIQQNLQLHVVFTNVEMEICLRKGVARLKSHM